MEKGRQMYTGAYDVLGALITYIGAPKHLCEECSEKLDTIKDQLEHEEDIFDMTDEDIELLRYTFKAGDEVVTSDGRTGKIRDICTCDKCKERGFYEANIDYDDETTDWLMIPDKKNGFKSYYSIGDRVFGNLDEESVNKELEEIGGRYNKLVKQQSVIYYLKTKKESTNEI
jgi:hypothetical protein